MAEVVWLIDGYNVLHRAFPGWLEQGDLESAREALNRELRAFLARRTGGARVVIVYDGAEGVSRPAERQRSFEVIFSRPPRAADDVILEYARRLEGTADVRVVTSDLRDIGGRVRGLRVSHWSAERLAAELRDPGSAAPSAGEAEEKPSSPSRAGVDEWLREFGLLDDEGS